MKIISLFFSVVVAVLCGTAANAQKCYIPKPMTQEQMTHVRGVWTGNYKYEGKQYPLTVKLYTTNEITCQVVGAPVEGSETGEQLRFCDGGEFHLKKMIGEFSYEFQGTPKNHRIEGMLTVRKNDTKVGTNGRFLLERSN